MQIIVPDYSVEGRKVDFALCHPPLTGVRQIGQIEESGRQLFSLSREGTYRILTDGQEWHFFGQEDYNERRVYKLDLIETTMGRVRDGELQIDTHW